MKNNVDLQKLNQLMESLLEYQRAEEELRIAEEAVEEERKRPLTAVDEYDRKNKKFFISDRIDPKPHRGRLDPTYNHRLRRYYRDYEKAEADYYSEHYEIRKAIERRDEEARESRVRELGFAVYIKLNNVQKIRQRIMNQEFLPENMKNIEDVTRLIRYFNEGLVDTLKEALVIYERDQKLENLQQQLQKQEELHRDTANQIQVLNEKITVMTESMEEMTKLIKMLSDQNQEILERQKKEEEANRNLEESGH